MLGVLRRSEGNFTEATRDCLADDLEADRLLIDLRPESEAGLWFLVRGVNPSGPGTYDTGGGSQVGNRDEEIAASPVACP